MTTFLLVYFSLVAFMLGACIGSFLNVCIYRIPREESVVKPRSHCPHCGKMIAWYDNVPLLSYLLLRARCRHCGGQIIPRYFLVELLTAVLFLLIWLEYGFDVRTPVYGLMVSGLILGTFVDFEHMIIPDRVSIGGIVVGLVCSVLFPSLQGETRILPSLVNSVIGLVAGSGSLWLVGILGKWAFKKDAMGLGDVKLLGGMGALLGWEAVLFIVMVSSLMGSVIGGYLIIAGKKEWQSRIPYGPYLALSAVIWILWGQGWWKWYVNWLGGGSI